MRSTSNQMRKRVWMPGEDIERALAEGGGDSRGIVDEVLEIEVEIEGAEEVDGEGPVGRQGEVMELRKMSDNSP